MTETAPCLHKVQYYETDQMGVVHHSNYIRWFEEARTDLLERAGLGYDKMEERGIMVPVLAVSCEYKSSVRYGESVAIIPKVEAYTGPAFDPELPRRRCRHRRAARYRGNAPRLPGQGFQARALKKKPSRGGRADEESGCRLDRAASRPLEVITARFSISYRIYDKKESIDPLVIRSYYGFQAIIIGRWNNPIRGAG